MTGHQTKGFRSGSHPALQCPLVAGDSNAADSDGGRHILGKEATTRAAACCWKAGAWDGGSRWQFSVFLNMWDAQEVAALSPIHLRLGVSGPLG